MRQKQTTEKVETIAEIEEMDRKECQNYFVNQFPFSSFREGQERAVRKIADAFNEGYKYVVLDAPTGAGKSAINTAFARGFPTSFYTTPQNSLIDQIEEDDVLKDYYRSLKGKTNYKCDRKRCYDGEEDRPHRADRCQYAEENEGHSGHICCDASIVHNFLNPEVQSDIHSAERMESALRKTACSYPKAVYRARTHENMLTNTFLYSIAPFLEKRHLTVIDESHNLESVLFNFCDMAINSNNVPFFDEIADDLPKEDPEKVMDFVTGTLAEEVQMRLEDSSWAESVDDNEVRQVERLEKKIRIVRNLDEDFLVDDYEDLDDVEGVKLKPVYCGDFFNRFIRPSSQRFLFSSATFQNAKQTLSNLGISKSDIKVVRMPSKFPVENRPIFFRDVTDLRSKNSEDGEYKQIAEELNEIAEKHEGEKGIVHCVSYNRMRNLKRYLRDMDCYSRIMSHESKNADKRIEQFQAKRDDSILLSVGKEEGIDLEDDDARFNVITKVPNANMGDERIRYRTLENNEWQWYNSLTAMRLAQSYGRSTRSEEDWSKTYILDSSFQDYYSRNKHLLPDWFCSAVDKYNRDL